MYGKVCNKILARHKNQTPRWVFHFCRDRRWNTLKKCWISEKNVILLPLQCKKNHMKQQAIFHKDKDICKNLAGLFCKKYGTILYSGTLAIESALMCAGIKRKDKVLVSGAVCNSVLNAIIRTGAIPVVVVPKNAIKLETKECLSVLKQEKNIKCVILTHQYGIAHDVLPIKQFCGNKIPIIEDVAQAYDIVVNSYPAGKYSDYIVTSFGNTKPLNYGVGGAIFSNRDLTNFFDFCDNTSRMRSNLLFPYIYPEVDKINYRKLLRNGNKNVKKQRQIASVLEKGLENISCIEIIKDNPDNKSVWHRYPIFVKDKKYYQVILNLLEKTNVKYQLMHEIESFDLPMFKNKLKIINKNKNQDNIILLRTRNNDKKDVKKFLSLLKKVA